MHKLKNECGETLIESLASILIAAITFALLATVIVTAGRLNARARNADISFTYADSAAQETQEVRLQGETGKRSSGSVALYESNGYYYYEPNGAEVSTP